MANLKMVWGAAALWLSAGAVVAQQAEQPASPVPAPTPEQQASTGPDVDEVIVTAARRAQNVQDVVGGIQVFTGDDLEKEGADGFKDYVLKIPGLGYRKDGSGGTKLGLRGVSNVGGNLSGIFDGTSTVGLYLNDVPIQGSGQLPDLALYDLNRIEVLKGPQGTLYGEGSMGGAIRMIVNEASLTEYDFKADSRGSMTQDASENWWIKIAGGGPIIEDVIGLRLIGTYREDTGYINYTTRGVDEEDTGDSTSLRAISNFQLTENFKGEIDILYNQFNLEQFHTERAEAGEFKNNEEEDTFAHTDFFLGGLTLKYDFGFAEFTSVTAWVTNDKDQQYRFGLLGGIIEGQVGSLVIRETLEDTQTGVVAPALPIVLPEQDTLNNEPFFIATQQETITQELRLVSNDDRRLDWVLGAFYRQRETNYQSTLYEPIFTPLPGPNEATQQLGDPDPTDDRGFTRDGVESFEQMAGYVEGVYELTETLELTAGMRYFEETISLNDMFVTKGAIAIEYMALGSPTSYHTVIDQEVDGWLPKASLAWYPGEDLMFYGVISRGFRSGGPNAQFNFQLGKEILTPDYLWNHEAGFKSQWFGKALTVNGAGFFLDWEDLQAMARGVAQIGVLPVASLYFDNIGNAEVYGAELEIALVPFQGMMIAGALGVLEGELTEANENANAYSGTPLPNTPEFSASLSMGYTVPLFTNYLLGTNVAYQYVDEQTTVAVGQDSPDGFPVEARHEVALQVSLDRQFGELGVGLTLFVDNALDERREYTSVPGDVRSYTTLGRPRTVGLSLRGAW